MTTAEGPAPGAAIVRTLLSGAPNFRDFGGARTTDGRRVRRGFLFRSQVLEALDEADLVKLGALGIRAVCDLRSADEQARQINRWPSGAAFETIRRTTQGDVSALKPSEWLKRLSAHAFDEKAAHREMEAIYRRLPVLFADHLAALFRYLDRPDSGPVLVHCTAGKDRTGFICAMVLTALGVPPASILPDYLESRRWFTLESMHDRIHEYLGGAVPPEATTALRILTGVHESFLAASFARVEADHGSAEVYLRQVAGLSDEMRTRLKEKLLEP